MAPGEGHSGTWTVIKVKLAGFDLQVVKDTFCLVRCVLLQGHYEWRYVPCTGREGARIGQRRESLAPGCTHLPQKTLGISGL